MKRSRPGEDLGAASTPKPRDGHKLYAQGTSARAVQVERIRDGIRGREVGVGSDVTYWKKFGFSLSVMESALVYWGGTT